MALTINTVKTFLQIEDGDRTQDALLNILISGVASDVKAYCNITTIPTELDFTMLKMVAYNFKNNGFVQSESIGDSSTTFFTDYPTDIKAMLNQYRTFKW